MLSVPEWLFSPRKGLAVELPEVLVTLAVCAVFLLFVPGCRINPTAWQLIGMEDPPWARVFMGKPLQRTQYWIGLSRELCSALTSLLTVQEIGFSLLQLGVSGAGGEAWGSMHCLSREGEEGKDWYKSCEKFCFSLSYLRGRELIQPTNGYRLVTDGANCIIHYDSDWNEIMEGNFLSHSSRSDESIYYSLSVYLWMQIEFGDSNWWNVRNIKLIRADRKRNYWVELASDFTIPCTGLSFD